MDTNDYSNYREQQQDNTRPPQNQQPANGIERMARIYNNLKIGFKNSMNDFK